jgi:hypothetical protein
MAIDLGKLRWLMFEQGSTSIRRTTVRVAHPAAAGRRLRRSACLLSRARFAAGIHGDAPPGKLRGTGGALLSALKLRESLARVYHANGHQRPFPAIPCPSWARHAADPCALPHHRRRSRQGRYAEQFGRCVVAYWSSHLADAKSELIVPGPHGSFALPQTVSELKRILRLNLAAVSAPRRNTNGRFLSCDD